MGFGLSQKIGKITEELENVPENVCFSYCFPICWGGLSQKIGQISEELENVPENGCFSYCFSYFLGGGAGTHIFLISFLLRTGGAKPILQQANGVPSGPLNHALPPRQLQQQRR